MLNINGRKFKSSQDAADFYGVTPSTVNRAVAGGRTAFLGTGHGGGLRVPVKVRDLTFASIQECADYFGVSRHSVSRRLDLGTIDTLGK